MILAIGVDIVNIVRIENIYNKYGSKFLYKILSEIEILKISTLKNKSLIINFLAKRFAAKEAVAKALGSGIGRIGFKDIVVNNLSNGYPIINICAEKFPDTQYMNINISLSDDYPNAIAFCVINNIQMNS